MLVRNRPANRAEALALANEVGMAYYAQHTKWTSRKTLWVVTRSSKAESTEGERVSDINSLSRDEAGRIVEGLNNAFQLGIRYGNGQLG